MSRNASPRDVFADLHDGDLAVGGIDETTHRIDRRARLGGMEHVKGAPKQLICFLCGCDFGTASLKIHEKSCRKKRTTDQALLPRGWRRPEPAGPALPAPRSKKDGGFDAYNAEAWRIYCSGVGRCCGACGEPFSSPEREAAHVCDVAGGRPSYLPRCVPTPAPAPRPEPKTVSKLHEAVEAAAAEDPWASAAWETYDEVRGRATDDILAALHVAATPENVAGLERVVRCGATLSSLAHFWRAARAAPAAAATVTVDSHDDEPGAIDDDVLHAAAALSEATM